ncbi:MAG: acetyltransferase family protein [Micavibrio sp.]|nr:acetyltransferase family protein [Micavibrio sp.]
MNEQGNVKPAKPALLVEQVKDLSPADLEDLCDATDAAIVDGGGFGWVKLPSREILERFWHGVLTMPNRMLFVARLDGVICGTAQIIAPSRNNEAQIKIVAMTTVFVAPWARGHGLARMMVEQMEEAVKEAGFNVINLDVRETQLAAIKLYEDRGYVHFGTHPYYAHVDGKDVPGHYYYKKL